MPAQSVLDTRALLAALTASPVSPSALAKVLKVSRATLHRKMTVLIDEGLVMQAGSGPASTYRLKTPAELLAARQPPAEPARRVFMEMTPRTATLVHEALEQYSRLGIGQFGPLIEVARMGLLTRLDGTPPTQDQLADAEAHLDSFKRALLGMEPNSSHGIRSPKVHDDVKETWAVAKQLRHRMAWDQTPAGSMGVWHDEPSDGDKVEGLEVHSGVGKAHTVDVSELPEGMLLQFKAGLYRVIGPTEDGEAFELYGESHSWQTAIQRAKNVAKGARARAVSF